MLYAIVGMLVIILDQGVKYWVTNNIMLNTITEPLIPGVLSLVRMHNDGAAFSFLSGGGARIYFIILTGVFTLAVILALATKFIRGGFGRWCLVLVTAGGLSNCLDRILYGYVVDMFKIDLFDFAVFNTADVFITVFSLLFIIYVIFGGETVRKGEGDEFDEYDDESSDSRSLRDDVRDTVDTVKSKKPSMKLSYEAEDRDAPRRGAKRGTNEPRNEKRPVSKREADSRFESLKRPTAEDVSRRMGKASEPTAEDIYAVFAAKRAGTVKDAPKSNDDDPFAAWEKANGRARADVAESKAAKAMGVSQAKVKRVEESVPEYVPQKRQAPVPTPKAAAKAASDDEFDLDAILAEFK
ncbi:MAG: signal peptidase II [Eubacteriales bacterium]|nr:signal peptidase II [Eubacteriales bacterium]